MAPCDLHLHAFLHLHSPHGHSVAYGSTQGLKMQGRHAAIMHELRVPLCCGCHHLHLQYDCPIQQRTVLHAPHLTSRLKS